MTSDLDAPDDGQAGAEAFEQSDEAFDESVNLDPGFLEAVEQDPTLDPAHQIDSRELEEIEGQLDDPDHPGSPLPRAAGALDDDEGWALDEPLA